jgi:hypothetical protein
MRALLYKANLVASISYAATSIFVCSSYQLYWPHAVGHLAPAASALIAAFWALHCWQLGIAINLKTKHAIRNASVPLFAALVAGIVCWVHYNHDLTKPFM